MKRFSMVVIMAVFALGVFGCGKKKDDGSNLAKEAEALKKKVCACKDVACSKAAGEEFRAFMKKAKAGKEPSDAVKKKVMTARKEARKCRYKLQDEARAAERNKARNDRNAKKKAVEAAQKKMLEAAKKKAAAMAPAAPAPMK